MPGPLALVCPAGYTARRESSLSGQAAFCPARVTARRRLPRARRIGQPDRVCLVCGKSRQDSPARRRCTRCTARASSCRVRAPACKSWPIFCTHSVRHRPRYLEECLCQAGVIAVFLVRLFHDSPKHLFSNRQVPCAASVSAYLNVSLQNTVSNHMPESSLNEGILVLRAKISLWRDWEGSTV